MENFGERLALLLGGHSWLHTDRRHLHISNFQPTTVERTSMLTTPRILISKLATARIFCYPFTMPNALNAPSLSMLGSIGTEDLQREWQRQLLNASDREIWKKVDRWYRSLGWSWFSCLSVISVFHSLILVLVLIHLFGFERLVAG